MLIFLHLLLRYNRVWRDVIENQLFFAIQCVEWINNFH